MKKEIKPYTIFFSISNLQQLDLKVQFVDDNCKISFIPVPGLILCKYHSNGNFKFLAKADSKKNLFKFGLKTPYFSILKAQYSIAFQFSNSKDLKFKFHCNNQNKLLSKLKMNYNIPKNSISNALKMSYKFNYDNLLQNEIGCKYSNNSLTSSLSVRCSTIIFKHYKFGIIDEIYNYGLSNDTQFCIYIDQFKRADKFRATFSISHDKNFFLGISKTCSFNFGKLKFSGMIDSTIKPRIKLHLNFE